MASILVGYDGSDSAKHALVRAAGLHTGGDRFGVISVVPLVATGPRSGGPFSPGDDPERHRAELDEAQQLLTGRGIDAELIEAVGDPGTAICEAAQRHEFDMIVVGSRNLRGMKRLLLGSVSDRVARYAPCDVLIVK
jgi:nucleotide-binding universal stress UspA family protein